MVYFDHHIVNNAIIKLYGNNFWQFQPLKCHCHDDDTIISCTIINQNQQIYDNKIDSIIRDGRIKTKINGITNNIVKIYLQKQQKDLLINNIPKVLAAIITNYATIALEPQNSDIFIQNSDTPTQNSDTDTQTSDLDV